MFKVALTIVTLTESLKILVIIISFNQICHCLPFISSYWHYRLSNNICWDLMPFPVVAEKNFIASD